MTARDCAGQPEAQMLLQRHLVKAPTDRAAVQSQYVDAIDDDDPTLVGQGP